MSRTSKSGCGLCGMGSDPKIARAAPHFWEEPCISGEKGSGTVFFSGCSLKCVFCQNGKISSGGCGKTVSVERLREIYFELIEKGVHNINLVNPTHFTHCIARSLASPLPAPVVWNSGGYDSADTLRAIEGKVQIFLPDMKYMDAKLAARYSGAPDYPEVSKAAILEMFRQTGRYALDADGVMTRGVMIRHLVLPGALDNTKSVIDWVSDTFKPGDVMFSLMSQFTPTAGCVGYPEINRRLTEDEHAAAIEYLSLSGIEDGFYQELGSASDAYIPEFDLSGV